MLVRDEMLGFGEQGEAVVVVPCLLLEMSCDWY